MSSLSQIKVKSIVRFWFEAKWYLDTGVLPRPGQTARSAYLRFLTEGFTVWGVTFQNWMPLFVVIFIASMTALKEKL